MTGPRLFGGSRGRDGTGRGTIERIDRRAGPVTRRQPPERSRGRDGTGRPTIELIDRRAGATVGPAREDRPGVPTRRDRRPRAGTVR